MKRIPVIALLLTSLSLLSCHHKEGNQQNTKNLGIGIYPGAPKENFSPELVPGGDEYRNIAHFRIARHSSSAFSQSARV